MSWRHREPRLEDMLADSIVKAVMEADGVDPRTRNNIPPDRGAFTGHQGEKPAQWSSPRKSSLLSSSKPLKRWAREFLNRCLPSPTR